MATRRNREEKERLEYYRKLNSTVDSIIAVGVQAGKVYTKYDRMRLLAFNDERYISDYSLNSELERIKRLENVESTKKKDATDEA